MIYNTNEFGVMELGERYLIVKNLYPHLKVRVWVDLAIVPTRVVAYNAFRRLHRCYPATIARLIKREDCHVYRQEVTHE